MRKGSNIFHWLFGAILGIVAIFAVAQSTGIHVQGIQSYIWPCILSLSGASLTTFLFLHHGVGKVKLTAKATWSDLQQKQHSIMGFLIAVAGVVEILRVAGALLESVWGMGLPIVLAIVGSMFIAHTQHGTEEATHRAVRYHRLLGSTFVLTGLIRGAQIVLSSIPAYMWAGVLLVVALMLSRLT